MKFTSLLGICFLVGLLGVACLNLLAHENDPTRFLLKVGKTEIPAEVAEEIRNALNEEAIHVADANAQKLASFWLIKEIQAKATPEQIKNGLTYQEIPMTSVVGVIQLHQNWIDFRKQEIPKGIYTLRFAIQPMTGDHMGTAPFTEFCLLSAVAKDTKLDLTDLKSLVEQSGDILGGTHPCVMLLFPNTKPEKQPTWVSPMEGVGTLSTTIPVVAEKERSLLGFRFVLQGHTKD